MLIAIVVVKSCIIAVISDQEKPYFLFFSAGVTAMISLIGQASLYCTSIDLVKSIKNPSVFCKISGIFTCPFFY